MKKFRLIGYGTLFGDDTYPAPVLPVGHLHGRLRRHVVVIYTNKSGKLVPVVVSKNAAYNKLTPQQVKALSEFKWCKERLFAYGAGVLTHYEITNEQAFFAKFLSSPESASCSPRVRRVLERVAQLG